MHDAGAVHEMADKLLTEGSGVGSAAQVLPSHASTSVCVLEAKTPAPTVVQTLAEPHETA